ncbi:MAG TPA: hypothetical protein VEC12_09350 [Bacteroidia bacterium]|nr:hypothetical protein [Bacteroidia bacterium]
MAAMKHRILNIISCAIAILFFSCNLLKPAPKPPDRYKLHFYALFANYKWKIQSYYSSGNRTRVELGQYNYHLHFDSATSSLFILKDSKIAVKGNTIVGFDTQLDKRLFIFPMVLGLYHYHNDGTGGVLNGEYWNYNLNAYEQSRDSICGEIMSILNYANRVSILNGDLGILLSGDSWAGDSLIIYPVKE